MRRPKLEWYAIDDPRFIALPAGYRRSHLGWTDELPRFPNLCEFSRFHPVELEHGLSGFFVPRDTRWNGQSVTTATRFSSVV